jgi:hypothetical protein
MSFRLSKPGGPRATSRHKGNRKIIAPNVLGPPCAASPSECSGVHFRRSIRVRNKSLKKRGSGRCHHGFSSDPRRRALHRAHEYSLWLFGNMALDCSATRNFSSATNRSKNNAYTARKIALRIFHLPRAQIDAMLSAITPTRSGPSRPLSSLRFSRPREPGRSRNRVKHLKAP